MARPQKIGIPPGGLAGQALIKSSDNDFEVTWGGPTNGGGGGNNGGGGTIANGFLGRPYAVWSGTGLVFNVYWPVYYIQGVQYPTGSTTITLDAADPTNARIDVIAVDSTGGIKITGTAAASPIKPTVDTLTQLEITEIQIAASATTPTGITDEDVYKENVEWVGSSNVSGANFNDGTSPFAGTKDTSIGSFTNGQYVQYVDGSTHDISDYTYLKFYVKIKAQFLSSTGWIITFKNGSTTVSSAFTVTNGIYKFDRTDTSGYQLVVVPLSEFTFSSATFDTVYFQLKGNNTSGFYFDNIVIQGGIISQSSLQNAITTIQTPSGAAVSDQPNDTFVFVGTGISAAGKTITFTGGGGGSGTVNSGSQYRMPYYSTNPSGTVLDAAAAITAARALKSDANGVPTHFDTATEPSLTELSYVKGVTSAIQTQ